MTADPITIYRLHELDNLPEPNWLIDGVLHQETIAAIVGRSGVFKTFLALDIGMSIATNRPWLGRKVTAGNVLHIVGEGGRGIKLRAHAWRLTNGLTTADTQNWACTVRSIDLMNQAEDLVAVCEQEFPDGLVLVIVDTLARNQSGDENSTQQMSQLVRQAELVRDRFQATVLFVHHFNRGGTFRGNSALDGAFDTIIVLERKGDSITVYNDFGHGGKQKDAEEFEPFTLVTEKVLFEDGKDSIVLKLDTKSDPRMDQILNLLDKAGRKGSTRQEILDQVVKEKVMGKTRFNELWPIMVERETVVPADGIEAKGCKWVRNVDLLDLAA